MKENNLQKKPRDAREYANLFLLDENGKKRDFSNTKSVCFVTIGYVETLWILLQEFTGKDITIIDRKSEIDFIEAWIKLHKRNDIRVKRIEVETDEAVHSTILKLNMNIFDLIIANPPYGKSSSLSKKIVKTLIENKVAKEMVVLAPLKSNIPTWSKIREIKGPFRLSEVFDIPEASDQDVYITSYPGKEPFTQTYEKVQMNKKQVEWFEAIERYNKDHENSITFLQMLTSNKKDVYSKYEENQVFEIPIYTPANGVQLNGQTGEHNLQEKPIKWQEGSSAPWGLYFDTRKAFENFRDWYYKVPYSFSRKKRDNINCLWDLVLSILLNIWGSDPSILKYDFILPHLDWSRPWTDAEILKEIGLPEDFLEKEEC